MLHRMTRRLIHVHQFEIFYLCYGVKCQSGVNWGHWGQKVIFTKNAVTRPCYIAWLWDSHMCISLRPYTYFMRSNVNLVSFGVTGVKRSFSAKMLLLLQNTWCYLYVTQCIYVAHKYALTWDSLLHSVGQSQLEIASSGRVRHLWWQMCLVLSSLPCRSIRQGIVSYSFLSSSSGNTSKTYSFDMPWPISTKLGHKNPWPMAFMSYDQNGVKGHVGVTGVKKVKNSKTLLLLQITGYDHVTHVYASAWPLLQKLSL